METKKEIAKDAAFRQLHTLKWRVEGREGRGTGRLGGALDGWAAQELQRRGPTTSGDKGIRRACAGEAFISRAARPAHRPRPRPAHHSPPLPPPPGLAPPSPAPAAAGPRPRGPAPRLALPPHSPHPPSLSLAPRLRPPPRRPSAGGRRPCRARGGRSGLRCAAPGRERQRRRSEPGSRGMVAGGRALWGRPPPGRAPGTGRAALWVAWGRATPRGGDRLCRGAPRRRLRAGAGHAAASAGPNTDLKQASAAGGVVVI